LFLRSESRAILVASQKEALRRNLRVVDTVVQTVGQLGSVQ